MPSRTQQLADEAANERSPLLQMRRESTLDYATHVPEDAPVVLHKHYNLAGLSQADFWILVSRPPFGGGPGWTID